MTTRDKDLFRATPQAHRRDTDDGCVVLDRARDEFHYLNSTGTFVLDHCDGQHRVSDIADLLMQTYGLERSPLDEVRACLGDLVAKNLIERATMMDRLRRYLRGPAVRM